MKYQCTCCGCSLRREYALYPHTCFECIAWCIAIIGGAR